MVFESEYFALFQELNSAPVAYLVDKRQIHYKMWCVKLFYTSLV